MEWVLPALVGAALATWCYHRRCLRIAQLRRDSDAYWERVRRDCPSCGGRRKAAASAQNSPG